jgi:hypothetical protein
MEFTLNTKRVPYRNKKITQAAEGEPCTICGKNDGTTVFAHFNDAYAGKGFGQKADDCAGFFLCHLCHVDVDAHNGNEYDMRRAYYRTIRRLIDKGVIK